MVYPVDGNKAIEYDKPVRYPINGVLARILKKGEEIKIILVLTAGKNSFCEENKKNFAAELEGINTETGAVISYDYVEIPVPAIATKQTYNRLITDLAEKIPERSELYVDMTYGFKPEALSLFCALKFVENFHSAVIEYIVYGKAEFNKNTRAAENPMIFDLTSLYYLFNLVSSMEAANTEDGLKLLKNFFAN
jgi:hypothetical protein